MNRPRKRFGQHFLIDDGITDQVISLIAPCSGDHVVEVGPGRGALTTPLLRSGCRLTIVELDRDLAAEWAAEALNQERLTVIQDDALRIDLDAVAGGRPIRLVGNLPYNVSTPLLFHFSNFLPVIVDQHLMLQREVVDRMASAPGSRTYGRLSVAIQAQCDVSPILDVPPDAFHPAPKVHSTVVRLVAHDRYVLMPHERDLLQRTLLAAFGQRRKTLRNALKGLVGVEMLESAGIDPGARAETVPVAAYVDLAKSLSSLQSGLAAR